MTGKITLISPPDVFVNRNFSIILVNTSEKEQEQISNWFASNNLSKEINIYFYNNENNLQWLVTAFAMSNYRYVNLDNTADNSHFYFGHFLSSENSFYSTEDNNLFEIYRLLNTSKVESVLEFLEKVIPIEQHQTSEL
jgi:hypothetical protein